jgi:hypothetical protein
MGNMMKDKSMMGNMMKMMNKKGLMSEECMKSCMKMMGEKEMDMNSMNSNNAKTGKMTDEKHKSHH